MFLDVVKGIRKVVEELSAPPSQSSVAPALEPGNSSPGKETHMPQASTPRGKKEFDVFLCHNSKDKPEVKRIAELLKAQGIVPWLDEWELRPGLPWQRALEEQIEHIKTAAVFVGSNGRGPWQDMELEAFIREFVSRSCPVIPVVLADAPDKPQLPAFLRGMTWVDFRVGDPDPMERLVWGITGIRR
jgi:nucleotide-binding universal stress UspA family protein